MHALRGVPRPPPVGSSGSAGDGSSRLRGVSASFARSSSARSSGSSVVGSAAARPRPADGAARTGRRRLRRRLRRSRRSGDASRPMLQWPRFLPRHRAVQSRAAQAVGADIETMGRKEIGTVTTYEILLMLDPEQAEARQDDIVARARDLVEKSGGTWHSHDAWGRRRLAYPIAHKEEGVYHLVVFDAERGRRSTRSPASSRSTTRCCATWRRATSRARARARRATRLTAPAPRHRAGGSGAKLLRTRRRGRARRPKRRARNDRFGRRRAGVRCRTRRQPTRHPARKRSKTWQPTSTASCSSAT